MSKRSVIFTTGLLIFAGIAFLALYFGYFLISPADLDTREEIFIVKKGSGLRKVAAELGQRGLVKNKDLFMLWTILKGGARNIKAGEYSLNRSMAPVRIVTILISGAVKTYSVTIPEGLTAEQIAHLLAEKNLADESEFISLMKNDALASTFHIDGPSLEGYLFPDTYIVSKDMDAQALIKLMIRRFWNVFNNVFKDQGPAADDSLPVKDIVTLASIVEKESGLAHERPIIASVFLNRLKKGMRFLRRFALRL